MSHLQFLAKRFITTLALTILVIVVAYWQQRHITAWLSPIAWLPYVVLGFSGLIAAGFGRSRLFFVSLMLTGLVFVLHERPDYVSTVAIYIMIVAGTISWRPDKGLSPFNVLQTLAEIMLVAVFVRFGIPYLDTLGASSLSELHSLLYQLGPNISARLTPIESIVFSVLLAAGLARVVFSPTHSHVALFITQVLLTVVVLDPRFHIVSVMCIGVGTLYLFAILTDSFNMAYRDELTGIPSRRALMQYVETLGRQYVVVMSDVDHFKKFNDTYGHDVGDQVLKLVASRLSDVGGGGRAFRYGGEEFTLVFPRKSVKEVIPHVEVLRQTIAEYDIVLRGDDRPKHPPKKAKNATEATAQKRKTVNVTCSFGVAERGPDLQQFHDIMKQADVALYDAKKAGRNCVKASQ